MIPESVLRGIRGLVHLTLRLETTDTYPSPLQIHFARATPYLTHLDLSGNGFRSFPQAIAGLARLQHLDISQNSLQIRQACLDIVMSLPRLCVLDVRKEEGPQMDPARPWMFGLHSWDN